MTQTPDPPIISVGYDHAEDGTFVATMTVTGLANEQIAQATVAYMQGLFAGQEIKREQFQ